VLDYHFDWSIVWRYRAALAAAFVTSAGLAVAAMAIGTVAGLGLAYAAHSPRRGLRAAARLPIDLLRNTPLLLLVFFLFLAAPQIGFRLLDRNQSFVLALSLVAAAHLAENFRAGIASIPQGYLDGARAIGLRNYQRQLHVVLPIALRYALPAMTNSYIAIFKDTSVASVIAVPELTYVAREIGTDYFRVFEAWASVTLIYLVACGAMALLARFLETRLPPAS
jgi:polar amino acid transport system permease protein